MSDLTFVEPIAEQLNAINLTMPPPPSVSPVEESYEAFNNYRNGEYNSELGMEESKAFTVTNWQDFQTHPVAKSNRFKALEKQKQALRDVIDEAASYNLLPSKSKETLAVVDKSKAAIVKAMGETGDNSLFDTWFEDVDQGKLSRLEVMKYRFEAYFTEQLYNGTDKDLAYRQAIDKFGERIIAIRNAETVKDYGEEGVYYSHLGEEKESLVWGRDDKEGTISDQLKKKFGLSQQEINYARALNLSDEDIAKEFEEYSSSKVKKIVESTKGLPSKEVTGALYGESHPFAKAHFKEHEVAYGITAGVGIGVAGATIFPPLLALDTMLMGVNALGVDPLETALTGEMRELTTTERVMNIAALGAPLVGSTAKATIKGGVKAGAAKGSEVLSKAFLDTFGIGGTRHIVTGSKGGLIKAFKQMADDNKLDDIFMQMDAGQTIEGIENTSELYHLLKHVKDGTAIPNDVSESVVSRIARIAGASNDQQVVSNLSKLVTDSFGTGDRAKAAATALFDNDPDFAKTLLYDVRASGFGGDGVEELESVIREATEVIREDAPIVQVSDLLNE